MLNGANLEVISGKCVLLCGDNGSGKTTLLRIISGLEKPDAGFINTGLGNCSWRSCRPQLRNATVYLHQQPYMFDGDVLSNLNFALPKQLTKKQGNDRIQSAIKWAELESIAKSPAKTLSGGERQRVAITRAWLRQPKVLLLDEPITNMDRASRLRTIQLLHNLKQQGVALIISSHDPVHFESLADSWLQLSEGLLNDYSCLDNITLLHTQKIK